MMANSSVIVVLVCLAVVSNGLVGYSAIVGPQVQIEENGEPQASVFRPCMAVRCTANTRCVESNGKARCQPIFRPNIPTPPPIIAVDPPRCSKACTKIYQPVCSSSGKTYSNKCMYEVAVCERREKGTTLVPMENCKRPLPEVEEPTSTGEDCNLIMCTADLTPVCGTDGITYPNACHLYIANCRGKNVKVASQGECNAC